MMIKSTKANILLAGQGTAGETVCGLSIGRELQRVMPGSRVEFAGVAAPMAYRSVTDAGFTYRALAMPGERFLSRLLLDRLRSRNVERALIRETRPSAVISMGGEIGTRLGQVAAAAGIPLLVFEPNLDVSWSTRRLAPLADLICLAFKETRSQVPAKCPVRVVGIPFARCESVGRRLWDTGEVQRTHGPRHLLVLGEGHIGQAMNSVLPRALARLRSCLDGWRIVHRARPAEVRALRRLYQRAKLNAVATSYIHKLPQLLSRAELVIAATTSAPFHELSETSAPIVFAGASRWLRQSRATRTLSAREGCLLVDQVERESGWIQTLEPLLVHPARRRRLTGVVQRHARADAAWQIATMVRDLIASQSSLASA